MKAQWLLRVLLVLALYVIPLTAQNRPLVLEGGTLIDGTGRPPIQNAVIVMEGSRIKAVGAKGHVSYPKNAEVIKADGKTILPGLIDCHVHFIDWMPPLDLHYGITTVYDTSSPIDWILTTRDALNSGRIKGPRMYATGPAIDGPLNPADKSPHTAAVRGGFIVTVQTVEAAKAAVRDLVARGVDGIKVYEGLTPEMLKAVVDEANKHGLQSVGHSRNAREATLAGLKFVEHTVPLARATISDPAKLKEMEEKRVRKIEFLMEAKQFDPLIRLLVKEGVYVNPTFSTDWGIIQPRAKEWAQEAARLAVDPSLAFVPEERRKSWLPGGEIICANGLFSGRGGCLERDDPSQRTQVAAGFKNVQEFIRRFARAGGKLVAGSDTGIVPGLELHKEMQALVDAGATPMQAILGATKLPAELFHKEKELGTVEVGKIADVIAIEGDPLQDISVTKNVRLVIMNGKVIDTAYDPQFKSPVPFPTDARRLSTN